MKNLALAVAGLALLATPSFGDRLDPSTVPSTARFLAHVDVTGLQKTELWKMMLNVAQESGEDPLAELRAIEEQYGIDPLRDIQSVTLYGAEADPESAVGMIVGNSKIDGLIGALQSQEGYITVEAEGLRLHVVDMDGERIYGYLHERGERRTVLVSQNQRELVRGALVLRGRQPNMADAEEPALHLRPQKGSFLYVAAAGELPGMGGMKPASAVFEKAKSFVFQLGEAEGILTATLGVGTESEESANSVLQILQGAVALARLAAGMGEIPVEIPVELLDGLRLGAEGRTVTAQFSVPLEMLMQLVGELGAMR